MFLTQNDSFILGPISKVLGYILEGIYVMLSKVGIENVALCIIIFTILIYAIMIPMNYKSQKSTRLTQMINPELQKIQEKYNGKKDEASMRKQQAETQALYDKYGISMASGCLPLLITLPILFAMYRVLYAIPAYITPVRDLYSSIADRIIATPGYMNILRDTFSAKVSVTTFKWADAALTENQAIDLLAKFSGEQWTTLQAAFPGISGLIAENSVQIAKINSFLGMNIVTAPGFHIPEIIIPILAGVTSWLSQKTMTGTQQQSDSQTLNSVNNSMKYMWIFSMVICISLPIGVGLYWIVGAVFRTVQQVIINHHVDKMDTNELIEKNREKAEKKRAKREKRDANVEKYSQERTRNYESRQNSPSISDYAKNSGPETASGKNGAGNTKNSTQSKEKDDAGKNSGSKGSSSSGSIASIAHILDHD